MFCSVLETYSACISADFIVKVNGAKLTKEFCFVDAASELTDWGIRICDFGHGEWMLKQTLGFVLLLFTINTLVMTSHLHHQGKFKNDRVSYKQKNLFFWAI